MSRGEDLAATVAREMREEQDFALQRRRPPPLMTSSTASDLLYEVATSYPATEESDRGGDIHMPKDIRDAPLPFEDAGLRGAGAIFLTRYGRGRTATMSSTSSRSNYSQSSPSRSTFHVVRARTHAGARALLPAAMLNVSMPSKPTRFV